MTHGVFSTLQRFGIMIVLAASTIVVGCSDEPTNTTPTYTPNKANGEYLVTHVSGCGGCHTPSDPVTHAPIASLAFAGGERFPLGPGMVVYSRNITPDSTTGIGAWTDDQIIAAIRTGIVPEHSHGSNDHDTVLVSVMNYPFYAHFTDNDIKDIVAYLRTLPAISNVVPADTVPAYLRPILPKASGIPGATPSTTVTQRGQYLTTVGECTGCHTPRDQTGTPDMTKYLAGGNEFQLGPGMSVWSANLTPDTTTGLGNWTATQIAEALTEGKDPDGGKICPPMPWQEFKGMTTADRDAIVAYLRGMPAINNPVPEKTAVCD